MNAQYPEHPLLIIKEVQNVFYLILTASSFPEMLNKGA